MGEREGESESNNNNDNNNGKGSGLEFVLVHGSSHGGWCWYKIRTLLETSGHKVTCLDLKASGIDSSDPNTILTFDHYNQPLTNFMASLPPNQKVVLVGHSAGGLSLTDAIHKYGEKIHVAVYVAANMLKYGFSTDQDRKDGEPDLSEYGDVSELIYGLGPDQTPTSVIIKPQFQSMLMYNTSPIEDSTLAKMVVRPAPLRAFQDATFVEGPCSDSVRRVYIKTLQDRVIKQEQQDAMIRRWPPSQIFLSDTDHSPAFSNPRGLVRLLLQAANGVN
ncbi:methylesterase 17-like [Cannabis sativa]|uniref:methylesterase 17-like n=1 Tax=Cannabis sativa TaxID=3483 RepID=UPI0029CA68AC|nr:methylesterase 17-like [Cannabis sativa]